MELLETMGMREHEQVVFCRDQASGLRAIIAVHDTTLGPALGGCRMWPYASESEALEDVLRLSRAMTYKNAAMGLDHGGGKAVIIADPDRDKTEALFRSFGRFVDRLGGTYYTAEDVGLREADIEWIARETEFVVGAPGRSGDPSPSTARGVLRGIEACSQFAFGSRDLSGLRVAVQGAGSVGQHLCQRLSRAGAELVITDLNRERRDRVAEATGAAVVEPDDIFGVEADLFAPCALGAVINDHTVDQLRVKMVAGSANNQLEHPKHALALKNRGILYAPDFVINGGGVIHVAQEVKGRFQPDRVKRMVDTIGEKVTACLHTAREEGCTTVEAAERLSEARIEAIGSIRLPGRFEA